jgi:hypothetical protein
MILSFQFDLWDFVDKSVEQNILTAGNIIHKNVDTLKCKKPTF